MSKPKIEAMTYVIHSFMCEDLGLSGAELLIFAIIRSFTKGERGIYYGTQEYLSRISGTSVSTVKRVIITLCQRGYIKSAEYGSRKGYKAVLSAECEQRWADEGPPNDAELGLYSAEEMRKRDIDVRECIEANERPKYEFHSFGSRGYVGMTAEQYKRLLDLVGSEMLTAYIARLEKLMEDKGYKTFSPYKTIKKWIYEDAEV